MKKLKFLYLIPFLAMSSCGSFSYAGNYSFRLGKDTSTHINVVAKLFNEDYEGNISIEGNVKPKKFVFDIDAKMQEGDDIDSDFTLLEKFLMDFLDKGINGYYYIGDNVANGKRILLGTTIKDVFPKLDPDLEIDIPPRIIESIVYSYIDSNTLTLNIPVSIDDVIFQLAWYGFYISFDSSLNSTSNFRIFDDLTKISPLPGKYADDREKRIGTLPTSDDIISMNVKYEECFSNTVIYNSSNNKRIGFISKEIENDTEYFCFNPITVLNEELDETSPTLPIVNLPVKICGYKDVDGLLSVGEDGKITSLVNSSDNSKIPISYIYEEPTKFRNIHTVPIGLNKAK